MRSSNLRLFLAAGLLVAARARLRREPLRPARPTGWRRWPSDKGFLDDGRGPRPSPTARWPTTRSRASTTSGSAPGWPGSSACCHLRRRAGACSPWSGPGGRRPGRQGLGAHPGALTVGAGHAHALYLPGTSPSTGWPRVQAGRHRRCSCSPWWPPRARRSGPSGSTPLLLAGLAGGGPAAAADPGPAARDRAAVPGSSPLFLPFVGQGERVEVLGLSLSVEGLWAAWNIVVKGTLGVAASVLLAATTPVPDLLRGLERLRCRRVTTDRRVHGPLRRRDRRRGPPHAGRPDLPRLRPPLDLAGQGGGRHGRRRCSSAPTSGASGSTWPWCRAATTGSMPVLRRRWRATPRPVAGRPRPCPPLAAVVRRHRLGDRADDAAPPPALEVEGPRLRLPRRPPGAVRRRPAGSGGGSGSPCSAPTAPARPRWCCTSTASSAAGPGRVAVAGLPVAKPST